MEKIIVQKTRDEDKDVASFTTFGLHTVNASVVTKIYLYNKRA